jgi:acetylornithine/N-succinyldiaminopimelate aminotransferase
VKAVPTLAELQEKEAELLLPTYERTPLHFVAGEGVYLIDDKGDRYLDLLSGIGVNALGYGHAAIENAIAEQSRKLLHLSNLFFHEGQAALAERLTSRTGLHRAFFCNSGTEAWEAALKLARAYAALKRSEGAKLGTRIIALEGSFHGRTFGALSTTHKAKYREPFAPLVPEVVFVPFNDTESLRAAFSEEVCAICIEAIQGEGGIRPVTPEFFEAARALTNSTGALLIADEIQSGVWRTGAFCAYQQFGIQPDVTTLAKPLAGGLPLGAMLCTHEAARAMHPGLHGTTFGGGPLACAVAIAVLDEIDREGLAGHVQQVGSYFKGRLRELAEQHGCVTEVRGMGLMLALELDSADSAKQVAGAMLARHIIINRTSDTVLRFLPPYVLEPQHVDEAVNALDEALTQVSPAASVLSR